jgi:hypothetical protein
LWLCVLESWLGVDEAPPFPFEWSLSLLALRPFRFEKTLFPRARWRGEVADASNGLIKAGGALAGTHFELELTLFELEMTPFQFDGATFAIEQASWRMIRGRSQNFSKAERSGLPVLPNYVCAKFAHHNGLRCL